MTTRSPATTPSLSRDDVAPVEDRVLWLTCEECSGTGSTEKAHPFPDDPEFCEMHRCEACGGSGRICR